jgi:alkanesulfonate monooxygenase SsuD/methylene tetrahydromethanopterin reductase-like flavin-dependent oxidoreductase (luciferase family)
MKGLVYGKNEAELETRLGGRDAAELWERGLVVGTPTQIVDQLGQLVEVGVQKVMLQWSDPDDLDDLEDFARTVLPQVQ